MTTSGARSPANGHLVPDSVGVDKPLSKQQEFINAKSYLLQSSANSGVNLYDHLAKVLTKILSERPDNVADVFEDLSKDLKKTRYMPDKDTLRDKADVSTDVALSEVERSLYKTAADDEVDDSVETPLPDLWKLVFFFEQGSVGLGREELYRVWLALKQLVDTHTLKKVRFWGKIFGTEQNYYVAEVEYQEGEQEPEEEEEEDTAAAAEKEADKDEGTDGEAEEEDKPPRPTWRPPPEIPREDNGTGTNKKVYFVCNDPGKPWVRLPPAVPANIQIARKIRKYFTGRLDAPVISYPPFNGNEANYLRAQIARISAGTQIAPNGFYTQDEGEDEDVEAEGGARDSYMENSEYQPIPVRELADSGMSQWVHITQHVLPQGRCVWWNPTQKAEDEFENEDEDEEKEEPDEPQREEGPPILTPTSEDVAIDGTQPWTGRVSSRLIPQYAIAIIDSNLWPGSHAFSYDRSFENVYLGWGLKYSPTNFQPELPPQPLDEYPSGPEITEIDDPTPEEEAAVRAAMQQNEEGEGEEGEEGEEEQEEDD